MLLDKPDDLAVGVFLTDLGPHLIVEVRPVEGTAELLRVEDAETLLDVRPHLVRGCCRQSDDRHRVDMLYLGNAVDGRPYVAVLGAEVMSPLRDAVRLVDRIERDVERREELKVLLFIKRFRSHIQQLRAAAVHIIHHAVDGGTVERRVEEVSQAVFLCQAIDDIDLIFHQCDQRRHDNSRSIHDQRRQLIAQALAATGRHQHKGVVSRHEITDDRFLIALEMIKAEVFLQCLSQVHFLSHCMLLR